MIFRKRELYDFASVVGGKETVCSVVYKMPLADCIANSNSGWPIILNKLYIGVS